MQRGIRNRLKALDYLDIGILTLLIIAFLGLAAIPFGILMALSKYKEAGLLLISAIAAIGVLWTAVISMRRK